MEMQEILLNSVAARRCLWDKTHNDFKDTRNVKNNNWQDVASEVSEAMKVTYTGERYHGSLICW